MTNIFDSNNARYLRIDEVAGSFIPNKDFIKLCQNTHSILMGPRGCGKTTLFKMLTPKAQSLWNDKNKDGFKGIVNFWGIYIPADKQWDRQLKNFQDKFKDETFQKIITKCIITTNVLYAIIETFNDLIEINVLDAKQKLEYQTKLSYELFEVWNIKGEDLTPSFYDIKKSLKNRIRDINSIINKVESEVILINSINWDEFYFYNYINLSSDAFETFEEILRDESFVSDFGCKWALCFDELEIVPSWVTNEILEFYLRSTKQNILFKLATAPLINWQNEYKFDQFTTNAQNQQDFAIIRSWVYDSQSKNDWQDFCEQFILSKFNITKEKKDALQRVFGIRNLNNALRESEKEISKLIKVDEQYDFQRGSLMYFITKKLAQQDRSFHSFLLIKGIDPIDPAPNNSSEIDSIFRKIKPVIVFRYYFIKRNKSRSRRAISLYHGYPFVTELSDGNPRVLINLLSQFTDKMYQNLESLTQIPLSTQGKIIYDFSTDYFMQITNHPDASRYIWINGKRSLVTLRNLLEGIGRWFFNRLIREPFKMDSVNCFTVDKNVESEIISLIKLAVDLGAIQFLVDKENIILSEKDILNSKFRFSYMLNPFFKLPKRSDNTIPLSWILEDTLYKKNSQSKQTTIEWDKK